MGCCCLLAVMVTVGFTVIVNTFVDGQLYEILWGLPVAVVATIFLIIQYRLETRLKLSAQHT